MSPRLRRISRVEKRPSAQEEVPVGLGASWQSPRPSPTLAPNLPLSALPPRIPGLPQALQERLRPWASYQEDARQQYMRNVPGRVPPIPDVSYRPQSRDSNGKRLRANEVAEAGTATPGATERSWPSSGPSSWAQQVETYCEDWGEAVGYNRVQEGLEAVKVPVQPNLGTYATRIPDVPVFATGAEGGDFPHLVMELPPPSLEGLPEVHPGAQEHTIIDVPNFPDTPNFSDGGISHRWG